jgi:hypothetical protein
MQCTVLENGWSEHHPLARGGWYERYVPLGFAVIYAPREDYERCVVPRRSLVG